MKILRKILQRLNEILELPSGMPGSTSVTVSEDKRVFLENYKEIIGFDDTLISIKIPSGKLTVTGAALALKAMADRKMVIDGKIRSIEWE